MRTELEYFRKTISFSGVKKVEIFYVVHYPNVVI